MTQTAQGTQLTSAEQETPAGADRSAIGRRPKIALVIDTDDWAFSNIARMLEVHLSGSFDFKIIPSSVLTCVDHIFLAAADCDMVHFFWREYLRLIESPLSKFHVERFGFSFEEFRRRYLNKPITTGVYDHLFLSPEERQLRSSFFHNEVTAYSVASRRLEKIYCELQEYPPPVAVLEDGVSLDMFRPVGLARFHLPMDRPIVIGWAGNSKWAAEQEDVKGFNTILLPALQILKDEGFDILPRFADRQVELVPHASMPAYYNSIDIYACTSQSEGTPNPVLEAMACGIPVVSVDVGVVPEVFGPEQQRFIVRERSVDAFADALRRLLMQPQLFQVLSAENLHSIRPWDWKFKAQEFAAFFDMVLRQRSAS
ncbi:D-inositol-3-phosphate glycosyltransferase [Achromobacter aegrifaciens]|uniref:glycosyltransferase n=1 Tax=Achromobacter aegrifaciens TaxID=1287736 RepID=UPI0014678360|nr:glycosyltransferase [Achromobacter aegrifaciens]CAB3830732.1 D-inositol-3-phosphate glycosyltransferase [Achromobacter aegrifaciens]